MKPEKITIETVEIDTDKVLFRLGYVPSKTTLDSKTEHSIDNLITDARKWLVPKAVYRTEAVSKRTDGMVCLGENELCIKSTQVASLLEGSFQASAFAVTIGKALSEKTKEYIQEERLSEATIIDAIGSVAVEMLANEVNADLKRKSIGDRAGLTKRYSPGYGDWNISEQQELLRFLSAETIGISLLPGGMMIPEKSVTAVVGWIRK